MTKLFKDEIYDVNKAKNIIMNFSYFQPGNIIINRISLTNLTILAESNYTFEFQMEFKFNISDKIQIIFPAQTYDFTKIRYAKN